MTHPAALPPETIRVQSLETAREHIQKALGLVSTAYNAWTPGGKVTDTAKDHLAEIGDSLEIALDEVQTLLEALRQP